MKTITSILNKSDLRVINTLIQTLGLGKDDKVIITPHFIRGFTLFDGKVFKNHNLVAEFQSDTNVKVYGVTTTITIPWPSDAGLSWFNRQVAKVTL